MLEPIAIAIAIVEHDGRYLVGQRPRGMAWAGYAEFPGGKVSAGESPQEAVVRECAEETGLEVEPCELIDTILYTYEHGTLELFFFQCHLISLDQPPRPPFAWLTLAYLAQCTFPPANIPIIRRLTESISTKN